MQNSSKDPVEGKATLDLLAGVSTLVVAKGRKTLRHDLTKECPPDTKLLALLLGRSGKLRAPGMRVGSRFLVGYNSEMLTSELWECEVSCRGSDDDRSPTCDLTDMLFLIS